MPFAVSDIKTRRLVPTADEVARLPPLSTTWHVARDANQRLGQTVQVLERAFGRPIWLAQVGLSPGSAP